MEKINTDYKRTNLKNLGLVFQDALTIGSAYGGGVLIREGSAISLF